MVNLPKSVMVLGYRVPVVVKDLGGSTDGQSHWQARKDPRPRIEISAALVDQAYADRVLFHEMTHLVFMITGWSSKLGKHEEGLVCALEELHRAWTSMER